MLDQLAVIVDKADGGIAQREQNRQRQRDQTPPLTADGAEFKGADGQSVGVAGLWPVGEGAGYAGGIMSAATDGIMAARKVVEALGGGAAE